MEILPLAVARMNLESVMLSEISQSEGQKLYNPNYKYAKQTHRYRKQTCDYQKKRRKWGGKY